MEEFYVVYLEQAKENTDVRDIRVYAGYEPYTYDRKENRVKRLDESLQETTYDMQLIVSYKEDEAYVTEILTGMQIPLINVVIHDGKPAVSTVYLSNEEMTEKTALYVVNKIIHNKNDSSFASLIFTDENNISKMDKNKALGILEKYKYFYTKETMQQSLEYHKEEGKRNACASLAQHIAKQVEEESKTKLIRTMLNELKNQS